MDIKIIAMFNKALAGTEVPYNRIFEVAFKAGYLVDPKCSTEDVLKFLREQKMNPNASFYKTWEDITSKSRLELAIDQVLHYLSTYGTATEVVNGEIQYNTKGNGYVPNENPVEIEYSKFKVIKVATAEEIRDDIFKMFASGIAMSSDTINVCIDYLKEYKFLNDVNIDNIKNREAQTTIATLLKKYPSDEFGLLRCIMYKSTGSAELIKSRTKILEIKNENGFGKGEHFDFALLNDTQLRNLSRIFYRYKPLFLAMKGYGDNAKYINKIRRLAVKNHKPLTKGFWEDCLAPHGRNEIDLLREATAKVSELNNYRKIQILQAIKARLLSKELDSQMYVIRNGKRFIREGFQPEVRMSYLMNLYNIVEGSLVEFLAKKPGLYRIPDHVHFACPTSEKNFIGNYPMGTSVDFGSSDNVIGVYWRNAWGTRDYDLHYANDAGQTIGWCYGYSNGSVIYSGDMTNADPEAAELFYCKKGVRDGIISLNKFNGCDQSKFKLFVAKENMTLKINDNSAYGRRNSGMVMCDPNNIVFETILDFDGQGQKDICYIHNDKMYLMELQSGYKRVSLHGANNLIQKANKAKADSYIDLEELLIKAGWKKANTKEATEATLVKVSIGNPNMSSQEAFQLVNDVKEALNDGTPVPENASVEKVELKIDLDLTEPTKEQLIGLFA